MEEKSDARQILDKISQHKCHTLTLFHALSGRWTNGNDFRQICVRIIIWFCVRICNIQFYLHQTFLKLQDGITNNCLP